MEIKIDEQKSAEILRQCLQESGLEFREKRPDEEGGFFVTDADGNRRKLSNNEVFKVVFGKDR